MAHSYTPGLRVARQTRIAVERRLPLAGKVLVDVGSRVAAAQVVARTELPGNVHPVNCAGILGVLPQDVESCLLVKVGDPVRKGQVIAISKSFFGLFKSRCECPCDGTLESASAVTGQVILREPPVPVEVTAYIDGVVTAVFPGEGVRVETDGAIIQGIFGVGGERHGKIKLAVGSPEEVLDVDGVGADVKGCILVAGSRVTLPALRRAAELGAAAVVAGGFHNADLRELLGYELGVAITGHEDLPTTLIMTEGFGQIAMAKRTFDLLCEFEGASASVSGATQIRAGVIRPEVIIPAEGGRQEAQAERAAGGLELGNSVRIIREPYFGKIGRVVDLPAQLQELQTGAKVRVLKVALDDGSTVTLPRANVEVIED